MHACFCGRNVELNSQLHKSLKVARAGLIANRAISIYYKNSKRGVLSQYAYVRCTLLFLGELADTCTAPGHVN